MRQTLLNMCHQSLGLKILGFVLIFFAITANQPIQAQEELSYLIPHFTSYQQEAPIVPGGSTNAVTMVTFTSISETVCTTTIEWLDKDGATICTTNSARLRPAESINHCSRDFNAVSAPVCVESCGSQLDSTMEGYAKISILVGCRERIGVEAKTYYTIFDENNNEIVLNSPSTRILEITGATINQ